MTNTKEQPADVIKWPPETEVNDILANAYFKAAHCGLDMKAATEVLETIRQSIKEKNQFDAWNEIDKQVALSVLGLRQVLSTLREDFEKIVRDFTLRNLQSTFSDDPESGLLEWLQGYVEALLNWRLSLCTSLVKKNFRFPEHAKNSVTFIKRYTPNLIKLWPKSFRLLLHLAEDTRLTSSRRSSLLVLAGEMLLYNFLKPSNALKLFKSAEKLDPSNPDVIGAFGEYYLQMEMFTDAIESFHQLIESDASNFLGYTGLGECYEKMGKTDLAEELYKQAIRRAPGWSNGYMALYTLYGSPAKYPHHEREILELVEMAISLNPDKAYDKYLDLGEIYKINDRWDNAHECFRKAIKLDPTRVQGYVSEGYSYSEQENYQQAVKFFTKAIRVEPNAHDGYWGMGWCYDLQGKWRNALKWYKKSLLHQEEFEGTVRAKIGDMKLKLGIYKEAEKELEHALKLEPENSLVLGVSHDLATEYLSRDRDFDAIRVYNTIYEILGEPYKAKYHSNLADWHLMRGNFNDAKIEIEKAFEKDKDMQTRNNKLSFILVAEGNQLLEQGVPSKVNSKIDEAIECYNKALEINPDSVEAFINKGYAYHNLGRYPEAIECYHNALNLTSENVDVWVYKGYAYHNLGRYPEAIECYNKALEINPDSVEAFINKGYTYHNLGRYPEAIECYNKALELRPNDGYILTKKGVALRKVGRYIEALQCYDRALDINPQDASALNSKAFLLANMNRDEEAIGMIEQAIEQQPNNPKALDTKGYILYNLGRYKEAIEYFEKAISIDPQYSAALNHKWASIAKLSGSSPRPSSDTLIVTLMEKYNLFLLSTPRLNLSIGDVYEKRNGGPQILSPVGNITTILDSKIDILSEHVGDMHIKIPDSKLIIHFLEGFLNFLAGDATGTKLRRFYQKNDGREISIQFNEVMRDYVNPFTLVNNIESHGVQVEHMTYNLEKQYYIAMGTVRADSVGIAMTTDNQKSLIVEELIQSPINNAINIRRQGESVFFRGERKLAFGVELLALSWDRTNRAFRMEPVSASKRGRLQREFSQSFIQNPDEGDLFIQID